MRLLNQEPGRGEGWRAEDAAPRTESQAGMWDSRPEHAAPRTESPAGVGGGGEGGQGRVSGSGHGCLPFSPCSPTPLPVPRMLALTLQVSFLS